MIKYQNGNTFVRIYPNGTKIRTYEGEPLPIFPEGMDIKITDYCDLNCLYCHESSSNLGYHADIYTLLKKLDKLPSGVELAIGGGNPLSHPNILKFLEEINKKNWIGNITINYNHIKRYRTLLTELVKDGLIKGLGISIPIDFSDKDLDILNYLNIFTKNIVYHVIIGVHSPSILEILLKAKPPHKILLLGYKNIGRGMPYNSLFWEKISKNILDWNRFLNSFITRYGGMNDILKRNLIIAFDNLSLNQLKIKEMLPKETWDKVYMGEDGLFSMYIDAVKGEYSVSSTSESKISWDKMSLVDFFANNRKLLV